MITQGILFTNQKQSSIGDKRQLEWTWTCYAKEDTREVTKEQAYIVGINDKRSHMNSHVGNTYRQIHRAKN